MNKAWWLGLVVLVGLPVQNARANAWRKTSTELGTLNLRLRGKVIDHTANHGQDRRMWARSLYQRRDLYVYLPPQFDPCQRYPLIMLLHGFAQDEQILLDFAPVIDDAIMTGCLPPVIVACPDGSISGEPHTVQPASFFLNTRMGDYQDFVTQDVWDYVVRNYPIRPERETHVLAGVSMGGFAAFNIGIRHRYAFGIAIGIHPPLNLRWMDDKGGYMAKFDPHHWGWRTEIHPRETIARFGLNRVLLKDFLYPCFGPGEEALMEISRENPIELIDRTCLRNGELAMFVGYAGCDEFNLDAQVESFLYLCKFRGLGVGVSYLPEGTHNRETAMKFLPDVFRWLGPQLAPFAPPLVQDPTLRERIAARRERVAATLPAPPPNSCGPEVKRPGLFSRIQQHRDRMLKNLPPDPPHSCGPDKGCSKCGQACPPCPPGTACPACPRCGPCAALPAGTVAPPAVLPPPAPWPPSPPPLP